MSSILLLAVGIVVLIVVFGDFLITTIGAAARPVLSGLLARLVFRGLRRVHGLLSAGRLRNAVAMACGTVVMVSVGLFWVGSLLLAWTLIYLSGEPSILIEGRPVDALPGFWDHWAHVGHLFSTLGGAGTMPADTAWGVVGALVGLMGMVVLTLSVSFILSTTQTVTTGRAMARLVRLEREVGLDALSHLIECLRSSPFAAYYSHPDETLGMPDMLWHLARRGIAGEDGRVLRAMLSDLPEFDAPDGDATDAQFLGALSGWCGRFVLTPPRV